MSNEKKKKKGIISKIMLISFLVPTLLGTFLNQLMNKTTQVVMGRKLNREYLMAFSKLFPIIIPMAFKDIPLEQIPQNEILNIYISFLNMADEVMELGSNYVLEKMKKMSVFQENNEFSVSKYNSYLIQNEMKEVTLLKILNEALKIRTYLKNLRMNKLELMDSISQIRNKQMNYTTYDFNVNSIGINKANEGNLKKLYASEVKKNNSQMFEPEKKFGYLVYINPKKQKSNVNVSEKEIIEYYEANKKKYTSPSKLTYVVLAFQNQNARDTMGKKLEHLESLDFLDKQSQEYYYQENTILESELDKHTFKNLKKFFKASKHKPFDYRNQNGFFILMCIKGIQKGEVISFETCKEQIKQEIAHKKKTEELEKKVHLCEQEIKKNLIKVYNENSLQNPEQQNKQIEGLILQITKKYGLSYKYLENITQENPMANRVFTNNIFKSDEEVSFFIVTKSIQKKIIPFEKISKEYLQELWNQEQYNEKLKEVKSRLNSADEKEKQEILNKYFTKTQRGISFIQFMRGINISYLDRNAMMTRINNMKCVGNQVIIRNRDTNVNIYETDFNKQFLQVIYNISNDFISNRYMIMVLAQKIAEKKRIDKYQTKIPIISSLFMTLQNLKNSLI